MRVLFGRFAVAVLLSTGLVAQARPRASFDLADMHVRPHTSNAAPQMTGGVLRGGRYDIRNATMLKLISMAYGMEAPTVLGGPNWLEPETASTSSPRHPMAPRARSCA